MIEVVGAHRVGMQLQAREVGHPDEGRGISWDDLLGGPAGRKLQRDDLDPVGSRLRCPLLVEELPINSVRIPYRARSADRRLPAGRLRRRRRSTARHRAWCIRPEGKVPSVGLRSRLRGPQPSGLHVRPGSARFHCGLGSRPGSNFAEAGRERSARSVCLRRVECRCPRGRD